MVEPLDSLTSMLYCTLYMFLFVQQVYMRHLFIIHTVKTGLFKHNEFSQKICFQVLYVIIT